MIPHATGLRIGLGGCTWHGLPRVFQIVAWGMTALFFLRSWFWKSEDLQVVRVYLTTWGKRTEVERETDRQQR